MFARRRRRNDAKQAQARKDRPPPASAPPDLQAAAAHLRARGAPQPPPPGTVPLRVAWRRPAARPPVVAAGHDGWLHHRLEEASPARYVATLHVPRGEEVRYKFLVDGKWLVDDAPGAAHALSADGTLHVSPPLTADQPAAAPGLPAPADAGADAGLNNGGGAPTSPPPTPAPSRGPSRAGPSRAAPVCGAASAPAAPAAEPASAAGKRRRAAARTATAAAAAGDTAAPHRPGDGAADVHPPVGVNSAGARRSVMMLVGGARWRSRLGVTADGRPAAATDRASRPPSAADSADGSVSLGRGAGGRDPHAQIALHSTASLPANPPIVPSSSFFSADKENAGAAGPAHSLAAARGVTRESFKFRPSPGGGKGRLSRRPAAAPPSTTLATSVLTDSNGGGHGRNAPAISSSAPQANRTGPRSSSRGLQKVVVSGPTRVDVPEDHGQVHRTAQNWRSMAQHLQEDLNDPLGARKLLHQAIEHLEKHGLWSSLENAQVHIDLARSLSKANQLSETEFHLRIALRIYEQVGAATEHKGDLVHYIAVVVDRQKKRAEAEELYREALNIYKSDNLSGDNVGIALKNLALNLKKQNRVGEADSYVRDYRAAPVAGPPVAP